MTDYPELESKIKTLPQLIDIVSGLKHANKTIVTNNGSYDLMHLGHVSGLFEAKSLGDVLIVGLNSDKSVRGYKGPTRPINDEYMRARMIAAISAVDYVFLFDEANPIAWLEQLTPHIHTNGSEYGEQCIERDTVISGGGKLHLLQMIDGYKTSLMIERIQAAISETA